jgi:hypothetical protein
MRRDPMTPRKADRKDFPDATTGARVFPLSSAPRRIARAVEWDRLGDEQGRRLRESWQEGAGVIQPDVLDRMRAVKVQESSTKTLDHSGNGLRDLEQKSP